MVDRATLLHIGLQVPISDAAHDAFMTPHRYTSSREDKMQPVVSSAMKHPLTACCFTNSGSKERRCLTKKEEIYDTRI